MSSTASLFRSAALAAFAVAAGLAPLAAEAEVKKDFKVCWSIYVGWMPWGYIAESGIMDLHAKKYGINVEIVQINDYVELINQYTAGEFDGCSMTNMDALSIPSAGGVDTTALIIGDFSNGNDGIILKGKDTLADIKGQNVNLVELSVSHYLLARGARHGGAQGGGHHRRQHLRRRHGRRLHHPRRHRDRDLEPASLRDRGLPGFDEVFNSSQIPGEIIDIMMVNTETLKDNPDFGKALVAAWYDAMG